MSNIHIFCGAGGVGKTTLSAAFAIKECQKGKRVAIITIDPARRLAHAFGLSQNDLSNHPKPIPTVPGLDAMILQPEKVFDDFVRQHATTEKADRLFNNRYYQYSTQKMSGIHEYMAMLRLMQLIDANQYDTIVLDTPPAKNALDFLKSPDRIEALLGNSKLTWLKPKRSWSALKLGMDAIQKGIDKLIGSQTLNDVFDFFDAFSTVGKALTQEARRIKVILKAKNSYFHLVCTPQLRSVYESKELQNNLAAKSYQWTQIYINRYPPALSPLSPQYAEVPLFKIKYQRNQMKIKNAEKSIAMLNSNQINEVPIITLAEQENIDEPIMLLKTLSHLL